MNDPRSMALSRISMRGLEPDEDDEFVAVRQEDGNDMASPERPMRPPTEPLPPDEMITGTEGDGFGDQDTRMAGRIFTPGQGWKKGVPRV